MAKKQNTSKKKEHSAHKAKHSKGGGGGGRRNSRGSTTSDSAPSPFNTQPSTRKQQSRNDKLTFLKSKGFKGKVASKLVKSGKKLSKAVFGNKQKRFGGGYTSRKKYQVKLPVHVPKVSNTPWHGYEHQNSNPHQHSSKGANASTSSKRKRKEKDSSYNNQILPPSYYSLPKASVAAFQDEIEAFAKYISLTPHEIASRQSVIQEITELSHNLWHSDVKIQPFGSFATLNVCTFQSDIDLALWNVVSAENPNSANAFGSSHFDNDDDDDDEYKNEYIFGEETGVVMSESSLYRTMKSLKHNGDVGSNKEKQKKDRIDEWKKMLDEVDLANSLSASTSPTTSSSPSSKVTMTTKNFRISKDIAKRPDPNSDVDEKKTSEEPSPFSFVIDREGVKELGGEIDDEEEEEEEEEEEDKSEPPSSEANSKDQKQEEIIVLDDESEAKSNDQTQEEIIVLDNESDDDDDDDCDKMNAFHERQHAEELGIKNVKHVKDDDVILIDSESEASESESDEDNLSQDNDLYAIRGKDLNSDEDAHSSTMEESNDGESSRDEFELNISNVSQARKNVPTPSIGPTGEVRTKVVKALSLMGKRLRKTSFAQNIEVRRKARVPIICVTTRFGFDADVALAGHNGTDTSHYVRKLVDKFESFSTVVLFLKVLLQQADLDKPYTGGLGSYKLYVLVANHFNNHKSLGGGDTATEMLLSFLYRYSTPSVSRSKARTFLSKDFTISSEGGEADLSSVSVDHCIEFFQSCFQRIMNHLSLYEHNKKSLVASVVDAMKVKRERTVVLNQSKSFKTEVSEIPHNHPGKITAGARVNHMFTKSNSNIASKSTSNKASKWSKNVASRRSSGSTIRTEKEEEIQKVGMSPEKTEDIRKNGKRSSRGALIPKRRIDIEMKLDGMDALLQRGAKRRKNKKKQNRDSAVIDFVMRTIK